MLNRLLRFLSLSPRTSASLVALATGAILALPGGVRAQEGVSEVLRFALDLVKAEQYEQARPLLEEQAALGSAVAAYNVGLFHEFGTGGAVDLTSAMEHYRLAHEAGLPAASFALGLLHLEGKLPDHLDYEHGRALITQAAIAEYAPAYPILAILWLSGAGGEADLLRAHEWACAAGAAGEDLSVADLIAKRVSDEDRRC